MAQLPAEPSLPNDQAALLARIERLERLVAQITSSPLQPSAIPAPVAEALPISEEPPVAEARPLPKPARTKSLESELGTRVVSKIGVLLLLMSAAWFLKWAFDNRWIGPTGRIAAGLVAGIALIFWSERFRRHSMQAFSYALKALGTGVLYLSLWAGFQVYHLLPATIALLAMVLVTGANGMLAVSQDAELLAGLALLGGLLTPMLLSTGGDHEPFLFSYLFVLSAFTVALLRFKPWNRLLIGVFPAVAAYFIGWYMMHFVSAEAGLTIGFALLLWAVFAAVPFVAQRREDVLVSVLLPLGAAAFGALSVYSVLADSNGRTWEPWCAAAFAAVYLAFARVRRKGVASTTHLSLAMVFLAVAITLKATGRAISVGWLAEAVALLWLASSNGASQNIDADIDTARAASAFRWLACALLLVGTIGALAAPYLGGSASPFLNRNFALVLGDVAALAAAMYFSRSFPEHGFLSRARIAATSLVFLNIVLLIGMEREIMQAFERGLNGAALMDANEKANFVFSGWMMLQGALLIAFGFAWRAALARWLGLLLLAATVVKAFAYDMRNLGTGYRVLSYLGLGVLLMCVSFAYQKDWLGLREAADESTQ